MRVCAKFAATKHPASITEYRVATDAVASLSGRSAGMRGN